MRLMYSPILLRSITQVLLPNYLPSQDLESGDTTKSGIKLLPGFSDIELIKNRLHNRLIELCLPNVMKIVTESPKKLTDRDSEEIVDVWNRKSRRTAV